MNHYLCCGILRYSHFMSALALTAAVCGMSALSGCGSRHPDRPPTYRAGGTVSFQGNPLADAYVTLETVAEPKRTAYGSTDANGKFQLTTFESGDGAVAGEHLITVTKHEQARLESSEADSIPPGAATREPPPPRSLIPDRYARVETSNLKTVIESSGSNDINLDLTE